MMQKNYSTNDRPTEKPIMYSLESVARLTELSVPYLRKQIREKKLKVRKAGRRVLVAPKDLDEWIEGMASK